MQERAIVSSIISLARIPRRSYDASDYLTRRLSSEKNLYLGNPLNYKEDGHATRRQWTPPRVLCNVSCARAGNCIVEKANLNYRTILRCYSYFFLCFAGISIYLTLLDHLISVLLLPIVLVIDSTCKCRDVKQDKKKVLWSKNILRTCLWGSKSVAKEWKRKKETWQDLVASLF